MFILLLKVLAVLALVPTTLFVIGYSLYHGTVLYEDFIRPYLKKHRQSQNT